MRTSAQLTFPGVGGISEEATVTVTASGGGGGGGPTEATGAATIWVTAGGSAWSAAFTASYVDQLTRKAGRPIRFGDFLAALRAALAGGGRGRVDGPAEAAGTWELDLVSLDGLEQLRAAKTGQAAPATPQSPSGPPAASAQHRCLIVTRTSGPNRVHFPLPLDPVETAPTPKPETSAERRRRLLRTRLDRLRRENASLDAENRRLAAEVAEAAALRLEAADLGARVRRARNRLDERRRRRRSEAASVAQLRSEVRDLRAGERATRLRLAEAEAALAGHRAAASAAGRRRPYRSASASPSRERSPSGAAAAAPGAFDSHARRHQQKPKLQAEQPLQSLPYEADIASIDKRLEQLRCFLDKALVAPAKG